MNEGIDQLFRIAPPVLLALTVLRLSTVTRRTSRSIGGRAFGFGSNPRQQIARLLFGGAILGAFVALVGHALGSTSPVLEPMGGPSTVVRLAGLILAVAGQILTVAAQGDMGRRWRVGVPTTAPDALVTTGLFGLSRNPVFLGMLAMAVGLAVAVPSPALIACATAFWAACEIQVRDEERFLESAFGAAYSDYRSAVRRWL